jgi:hypothetical protein
VVKQPGELLGNLGTKIGRRLASQGLGKNIFITSLKDVGLKAHPATTPFLAVLVAYQVSDLSCGNYEK